MMCRQYLTAPWHIGLLSIAIFSLWTAGCGQDVLAKEEMSDSPEAIDSPDEEQSKEGFFGIELGNYLLKEFHPIEGKRSTVSFALYAKVLQKDKEKFEQLLKNRQHKVRDQVIVSSRLLAADDYNDPELLVLRRRILLRLHRALPELLVQDIYISDFSYIID